MNFNEKSIKLVELCNTWQGEGPDCGRQMLLARFKYCDRHCSFCDTWIKMKSSAEGSYSINDLNETLQKTKGLMITGGEPTFNNLHNKNLDQTLDMIHYCNYEVVNIETNGFDIKNLLIGLIDIKEKFISQSVKVIYSPKIFTSKDIENEMINVVENNLVLNPCVYFKIVADPSNKYVKEFILQLSDKLNRKTKSKLYLMPLGITEQEIMTNWPYCIDLADAVDANLSTRMHIMNQFT